MYKLKTRQILALPPGHIHIFAQNNVQILYLVVKFTKPNKNYCNFSNLIEDLYRNRIQLDVCGDEDNIVEYFNILKEKGVHDANFYFQKHIARKLAGSSKIFKPNVVEDI